MESQLLYDRGWLLILIIIPVLCFLYWQHLRHREPLLIVTAIPEAEKRTFFSPVILTFCLRLLAVFLVISGLINPRLLQSTRSYKSSEEADIILALDVSRSMETEDFKPNRLEALKDILNRFIAGRANDRFGIVLYAGESVYWCPLTKNYPFLATKLKEIDDKALEDGTAIGLGLVSAVNVLHKSTNKNKVVVLLTDGENNTGFVDPLTAATFAKKFHIKVYTIGVGTNTTTTISLKDKSGNINRESIRGSIDEKMLKQIAALTQGSYFRAGDTQSLRKIYDSIDQLEKTKTGRVAEITYKPLYRYFIWSALLALLLDLTLRFTFFRTWPE